MDLLVISSYPEKHKIHGAKTVGGAMYAKNTLLAIKKQNPDIKIEVLAEKFDKAESYVDDGDITVNRIWQRNNIGSLFKLLLASIRSKPQKILIEFEMFMFGSLFYVGIFLLILGILKLVGKQNYVVLHQVVVDVNVFEKNKIKQLTYSAFRKIFYGYFNLVSKKIIVFEEHLRKNLGNFAKVIVIPLAVEPRTLLDQHEAKRKLGLDINQKCLLYFGYISPYKGIDTFIKNYPKDINYKLIVAGGPNPNHALNPEYMSFVEKVKSDGDKIDAISTGFVDENDIGLYFSACDIVVLPYQTFMSSSGPLSLAFSYQKPVMFSDKLVNYFLAQDFKDRVKELGLKPADFIFDFTSESIRDRISYIDLNSQKFRQFSSNIKVDRSWETISQCYLKELF